MREDLHIENASLREALQDAHVENQRLKIEQREDDAYINHLHKDNRLKLGAGLFFGAITGLALSIAMHFREDEQEARAKLQSEIRQHLDDTNSNKAALAKLAIRLENAQRPTKKLATPDDPPPTPEYNDLLHGTYEQKVRTISSYLGKDYLTYVTNQSMRDTSSHQIDIPKDVTVTGSHAHLTASEVAAYLKGYPEEWIKGKVKKITLHEENFGPKTSYSAFGETVGMFNPDGDRIDIYGYVIGETNLSQFDQVIAHEIAHGNDWLHNDQLFQEERVDLLAKILARVLADDRYNSGYVESINSGDEAATLARKCEEYLPVIAAVFFNNPTELNYKDYTIIYDLVSKKNPGYDIEEGKRQRVASFTTYREL